MPTPRHPRATVAVLLIGLSSVIQITGCSRPLNQSDQLLGTSPLSALESEKSISWVEVAPLTAEPTDAEAMAGTSIAPLDRSMAKPLIIRIQQAQVEHEPTYLSTRPLLASSTRADDAWPGCRVVEGPLQRGFADVTVAVMDGQRAVICGDRTPWKVSDYTPEVAARAAISAVRQREREHALRDVAIVSAVHDRDSLRQPRDRWSMPCGKVPSTPRSKLQDGL